MQVMPIENRCIPLNPVDFQPDNIVNSSSNYNFFIESNYSQKIIPL